jgi:putative DNA primase/helicase
MATQFHSNEMEGEVNAPLENLVERLQAKRNGKSWIACCPAHEDRSPSLSIDEGADGPALIKCHAG